MSKTCLLLLIALLCCSMSTAVSAEQILLNTPFAAGLPGWIQSGQADFTFVNHENHPSAQITVTSSAPLQYQQLQYNYSADVLPYDAFQADVDVRSEGLQGGVGAYIVLVFLDSKGQRVGIENGAPTLNVGSTHWQHLSITGVAPPKTVTVQFGLILQAHGTVWFSNPKLVRTSRAASWRNLGNRLRHLTIYPNRIEQKRFLGVGFDTFQHNFPATAQQMDQVLFKRWRELAPSFVRMDIQTDWGTKQLNQMAKHLLLMQETGTVAYITLWDLPVEQTPQDMANFAKHTADQMAYLIKTRGCICIKYFCISNELTLDKWGALANDLPLYATYQNAIFKAFWKEGLHIGMLATDASPISEWNTVKWAADHINSTTAVYGAHEYFSEYAPDSSRFYPWFLTQLRAICAVTAAKKKGFILGEFGCRGDGRTINGVLHDDCYYWNTPLEPYTGLQLAEAVIAALNSGVKALAYWTFTDFPYTAGQPYQNYWGMFKWENGNYAPRDPYFAYGLLTRWFRGPSQSVAASSSDPRLRMGVVKHKTGWSIVLVNRNHQAVHFEITMHRLALTTKFRCYLYNPVDIPVSPFGDLQKPAHTVLIRSGRLTGTIGPNCMVVYTSDFRQQVPPPVQDLTIALNEHGVKLHWKPGKATYYRIYREEAMGSGFLEIGTTIADHFTDHSPASQPAIYEVKAVDRWDNSGKPARIQLK